MSRTILITGVSSGLGRAIATAALVRGHRVAGTVRREADRDAFERLAPGRAVASILDLSDPATVAPAVAAAERALGPVEVLVNNAGYGLRGAIEELSIDALRQQFAVNVLGAVAAIQAVLPGMRARGSGHVVNITSMGAQVTFPGLGAYHGSKFALQGIGDALEQELKPLNIRVTAVQPGLFRSDWNGRSLVRTEGEIADYGWIRDPAREQALDWGDPDELARVVVELMEHPEPPSHLLVGPTAVELVRPRLLDLVAEIDRLEDWSRSTGSG